MRQLVRAGAVGLAMAALALLAGCDAFLEDPGSGYQEPGGGTVCYFDSDCVPADCCGEASSSLHVNDARSCFNAVCTSNCPPEQLDCGCAIPVCRDSRCYKAIRAVDGCL